MKAIISLLLAIIPSTASSHDLAEYPKSICTESDLTLKIVDVSYCVPKNTLDKVDFLGLNSHTVTISNGEDELTIGLNPPNIAISNLHKKFNVSVHDFFLGLYRNTLKTEKLALIKQAFDINESNKMKVYKKGNLFAFTITGSNIDYDRVYLNKIGSDIIYQITGEYDDKQLLEILARITY
ncbi:hypothetical protein DXX93_06425 [Thalassotalea euphylliae]|uniref:DUF1795 domain-containing protein n=1 Tax=Thalassotalea euphylliae TaxID=1655234 RepID=A0A3E0TQM3_9GAMM|nr:hypothetical protein [Thalassotalea euphylliae]REL26255.1 hypothetical protein DXX93_06425 [Thalassotalea euphylliae]